MDLTQILTPDNGALSFLAVVLWEAFKKFIAPRIPALAPYFNTPSSPASPASPQPASPAPAKPAPTPSPAPVAPLSPDRPLVDFLKSLLAKAAEVAPHLLPKLLPLLPLILEKPVEEPKPDGGAANPQG
jgi:hypothetical protein